MDALAAMSRFAGRIAVEEAIALRGRWGGNAPPTVLVIGAGHAGMAAARAAFSARCPLICASTGALRQAEIEDELDGIFVKLPDDRAAMDAASAHGEQRRILRELMKQHKPSILICTARRGGSSAPKLLLESDLALLPKDSVVVDLTAAAGGNVEPCFMNETVRTRSGVWVSNKSNYPSAEPRRASAAYAMCLAEILMSQVLANSRSWDERVAERQGVLSPTTAGARFDGRAVDVPWRTGSAGGKRADSATIESA